ncbi:MAG: SpoIIE family protein phosphatase, partial [Ignavibacteriae bacterium]|nr:SpoIIE family protein phosphatase [Ignavibacteriota bacterium]
NNVPSGEYATYLVGKPSGRVETKIQILKIFNVVYFANFLLGLGFLIVGYVVVMTKPQGVIQQMFAHYSIISMLFFALVFPDFTNESFWLKKIVLGLGAGFSRIIAPPLFLRFFFFFPVQRKEFQKRWIRWALYIVSITFFAGIFFIQGQNNPWAFIPFLSPYLFYVGGLLIFAHSYFKRIDKSKRKELRPILFSAIVGIAAFLYIFIIGRVNVFLIFLNPAMFIPGILIINVPIAFGYSIFRYRLMDIDLIIKRSLIYGTVTAALASIYLFIVFGVGNLLTYFMGTEENKLVNALALISIALVFEPVKKRTQALVDRRFYQERYNYQKALLEFSQELPRLMNLEQILHSIVNRISTTMHVEKISVVLCDEKEGCSSVSKNIPEQYSKFIQSQNGLIELLKKTKHPQSFGLLAEEPDSVPLSDEDKEKILQSDVVLSVPMFLQDRLIGTINVGAKMSGKVYSQEDIDLLSTVASQAAIAIENGRLHLSELEKQKMEEQLEIARKIQQSLLPKQSPTIERLDISGLSLPALSVGGDYFDYIQLAPKKLLVVVADVSGKGMSAALYMSKIQGMIQLASHMYESPRDMLIHVNRRLYEGIERKSFITMVLALFDLENNTVQICRAGHNKAIIGTNGIFEYLSSKGIGLGLERGPIFEQSLEEVKRPLHSDSLFFFYSDGLSEAMNDQQVLFGEDTICNLVETNRKQSASELQEELMRSVQQFQGSAEQHDDITFVVVKYI